MNPMFKAMQPKKKRPVDPNAPPRPNLMTHNVKIRTIEQTLADMENQVRAANARVAELEAKMRRQTDYMQALHNAVASRRR
jgi:predicted  nucleic acid-binding Zn-ribbon protein